MPTYEMFWDCSRCGTTKLLGKTHRHCPNCGSAQDPSSRYFPAVHERVEVKDHVYHGVDWTCEYCDTPNSKAATHCVNCGDAHQGAEADVSLRESVAASAATGAPAEPSEGVDDVPSPPLSPAKKRFAMLLAGVVLTGVAMCSGLFWLSMMWTQPIAVIVDSHSWTRAIDIEVFDSWDQGDWCDSMPSHAYGVRRSQQQRGTVSVPDGESCSEVNHDNGDGTFSTSTVCTTTYREDPVYDDYCNYTVDEWGFQRTATSSGVGVNAAWPHVSVSDCSTLGCTRQGAQRATYTVHITDDDGDTQECEQPHKEWKSMLPQSRWSGDKLVVWDKVLCSSLTPIEN